MSLLPWSSQFFCSSNQFFIIDEQPKSLSRGCSDIVRLAEEAIFDISLYIKTTNPTHPPVKKMFGLVVVGAVGQFRYQTKQTLLLSPPYRSLRFFIYLHRIHFNNRFIFVQYRDSCHLAFLPLLCQYILHRLG